MCLAGGGRAGLIGKLLWSCCFGMGMRWVGKDVAEMVSGGKVNSERLGE